MKRVNRISAALVCLCALLGLLCACAAARSAAQETCYDLYFAVDNLQSAGGGDAVAAEACSLRPQEGGDILAQAEAMVNLLLAGPSEEGLKSPFPANTQLLSVTKSGSRMLVDLSGAYSALSGVSLTLADYCITLTLTQLPGVQSVAVTVRGQELAYRDAQSFSAADVLLSSTEDVVGTVDVTLYFPDGDGILTGEARTLELYEGDTQAGAVLQALAEGPETRGLSPVLPEEFSALSVWTEEDICYVNLPSSALKEELQERDLIWTIQAIARSLRSLPPVGEVRFLVDGEIARTYGGADISHSF